jgi:hypothetical protein
MCAFYYFPWVQSNKKNNDKQLTFLQYYVSGTRLSTLYVRTHTHWFNPYNKVIVITNLKTRKWRDRETSNLPSIRQLELFGLIYF